MRPSANQWTALGACLCLLVAPACRATSTTPDDFNRQLEQADYSKTADNARFQESLRQLDAVAASLTPRQRLYLRYLHAWQTAYSGNMQAALPALDAVIHDAQDPALRIRAGVSAVNLLNIASRNEEAYTRLNRLLDELPSVSDHFARSQALSVASQLYTLAGQYDLGLSLATHLELEAQTDRDRCGSAYLKTLALQKSRSTDLQPATFTEGIATCTKAGEPLFIANIRDMQARTLFDRAQATQAIKILQDGYAATQATHYAPTIADTDATLALAYEHIGDDEAAQRYALRVVSTMAKARPTEIVADALGVLFRASKHRGDFAAALDWHEKFAAAQMGYLSDVSARALAYQMVHQQVAQK
ncbi:MAG: hypothetical protein JSS44_11435, partial [Proteobacteria bacterium]|nr:hypothetical protein [Pseudomonadota bacterium]